MAADDLAEEQLRMAHDRRLQALRDATIAIAAHHRALMQLSSAREAVDQQIALVASCDEQIAAMNRLRATSRGSPQQPEPDDTQRVVQSMQAQALCGASAPLDQRRGPTPELQRMQVAPQERVESYGRQRRGQLIRAEAEMQHLEYVYRDALAEHTAGMQDTPAQSSGEHCSAAIGANVTRNQGIAGQCATPGSACGLAGMSAAKAGQGGSA